jgi:predicted nucleic acid-binding protein
MFTQEHHPNVDRNEAISLIKEIMNSIKNTLDDTLVVVSFQQHNKIYTYDKSFFHDLTNTLKLQQVEIIIKSMPN